MALNIDILYKLRKNDASVKHVKQEYEIQKTSRNCKKSFKIRGYTNNETYMVSNYWYILLKSLNCSILIKLN